MHESVLLPTPSAEFDIFSTLVNLMIYQAGKQYLVIVAYILVVRLVFAAHFKARNVEQPGWKTP